MSDVAESGALTTSGPPAMGRAMMIKGLSPALPERGKIKIGSKGPLTKSRGGAEFQPPQKLDHFVITTIDRGADGNFVRDAAMHKLYGDKPTEIPVRLIYDDPALNFPTRYAAFKGRTLWCAGDGEKARRLREDGKHEEVQCPCPRQAPGYNGTDKCKMNGMLSVLIDGAGGVGGVWKFRTTSYNSVVGLLSSMAFIRGVTGGPLANLPLFLVVRPKQATTPEGKQQTVYIVGLEYRGDLDDLRKAGHRIALDRAKTHVSIEHIEEEAKRLLLAPPDDKPLPGDNIIDVVEEFYPEQFGAARTITVAQAQTADRPASKLDALDELLGAANIDEQPPAGNEPPPPADDGWPGDSTAEGPALIEVPEKAGGGPDFAAWLQLAAPAIAGAPDASWLDVWRDKHKVILGNLRNLGPKAKRAHDALLDRIEARKREMGSRS